MPSRQTTNFSNVSIDGTPGQLRASRVSSAGTIIGAEVWASVLSAPALGSALLSNVTTSQLSASRISSNVSILGNSVWASTFSQGGNLLPRISSTSSLVGAFVVQPSASSFTGIAWADAAIGDVVIVNPFQSGAVSSISSGLVPHSHITVAGQVEFRLSNVSTLAQNQSAQTWVFIKFRPQ